MTKLKSNLGPFLASFDSRALLMAPDKATFFKESLEFVMGHEHGDKMTDVVVSAGAIDDDSFWSEDNWASSLRPYVVVDGVLQIPIQGTLLNRFPFQLGRWATGYDYIERAIVRGMDDPEVFAIALVIDSGGGEVAGCFELVDKIFDMRGQKPIRAFSADHAYSAAYALASVADEIIVTRSGGTGSVGVVTAHFSFEQALKNMGVEVTFTHAGKHKVDGNPYQKLPKEVKARIKARVDKIYGVFTSTVARNRDMEEDDIRGTEALTFDAEESTQNGFADRIGALDDEMIVFTEEVTTAKDEQMATKSNTPEGSGDTTETVAKATHDSAVEAATATGRTEGAAAEKTRLNAILGSDEGKSRPVAALAMAMKSSDDAETVVSMLALMPEEAKAEAPKEGPKAKATPFEAAMDADGNPVVGATPTDDTEGDTAADQSTAILADFRSASGTKKRA